LLAVGVCIALFAVSGCARGCVVVCGMLEEMWDVVVVITDLRLWGRIHRQSAIG
jgi:hypothetical protein